MGWLKDKLKDPFRTPLFGVLSSPADTMDPGGFFHARDSELYKHDPFNKGFYRDDPAQGPRPVYSTPQKQGQSLTPAPGGVTTMQPFSLGGAAPPNRNYVPNPFQQQQQPLRDPRNLTGGVAGKMQNPMLQQQARVAALRGGGKYG